MSGKDFAEQLRGLRDELQGERLSASGEARLRRLLEESAPRRRPLALLLAPAAAAALAQIGRAHV